MEGESKGGLEASRARPAASFAYHPALDGLRGIAVLLVLLLHTGQNLWPGMQRWFARGGSLGVDLFFALSGFLITVLLLGEQERTGRIDLRRFAIRRAQRLGPALIVLFGVVFLLACFGIGLPVASVGQTALLAFTSTTNLKTPLNPLGRALGPHLHVPPELIHLWSLAIEVQFYALWGVALWGMTSLRWSYRRIALIAGVVIVAVALWRNRIFDTNNLIYLYEGTSTRLDTPMCGALAGVAFAAGWTAIVPKRVIATVGTIGLAVVLWYAFMIESSLVLMQGLYTVIAVCAAAAVVAAASGPTLYTKALANRPLVFFGGISYSLYLWHLPVFWAVRGMFPGWSPPLRAVVAFACSTAIAWASYHFVERRFLRRNRSARVPEPAPGERSSAA